MIDTAFEVSHAALVSCTNERLQSYVRVHPAMGSFLKRFHNEFGARIWPTVTMISEDAPKSVRTVAALGSFRDAICISAIVSAHARTLLWRRSVGILFADAFDVYPWFPRSDDENRLSAFTPGVTAIDEVKQLRAQPSPALGRRELSTVDCDRVLLNAILTQWENYFVNDIETVEERRTLPLTRNGSRRLEDARRIRCHLPRQWSGSRAMGKCFRDFASQRALGPQSSACPSKSGRLAFEEDED